MCLAEVVSQTVSQDLDPMKIGYARTSTTDQAAGLEAQLRDLGAAGAEKVFQEQVSSIAHRAQLEAAIEWAREGDVFVVTKLDRLARSIGALVEIVGRLEKKHVALRILSMGIDTGTPTGRLMLTMLGGIAQFEREIMLERQREGIQKAKLEGKYRGRAPTARRQSATVQALAAQGVPRQDIAVRLGISRASVYRVLAASPEITETQA